MIATCRVSRLRLLLTQARKHRQPMFCRQCMKQQAFEFLGPAFQLLCCYVGDSSQTADGPRDRSLSSRLCHMQLVQLSGQQWLWPATRSMCRSTAVMTMQGPSSLASCNRLDHDGQKNCEWHHGFDCCCGCAIAMLSTWAAVPFGGIARPVASCKATNLQPHVARYDHDQSLMNAFTVCWQNLMTSEGVPRSRQIMAFKVRLEVSVCTSHEQMNFEGKLCSEAG